ncbi:hypothetical protein NNJEOMEG_03828 [Fundidesulfovibrio magnetotacticus]|uniref:VOC domain-containing protein n=1 Tax=Fundidesulfovibrio magnetotacticus TaxID=2730080 RepID=A0A6V8M5U0_9BACT|nr:VOC family protein [Fundidesulfovibrio magnetotacticus]GFK95955.1 hypothetical protein NNJEOMEG_03828 [Fundidesulfovibrio magnetotacticus]
MSAVSLTPNLMVENVHRAAAFWCGLLGFTFRMGVDSARGFHQALDPGADLVYAQFVSGSCEVMVQRRDSLGGELPLLAGRPTGGAFTLYLQVDDLEALHARLKDAVTTVKGPETAFYGMREWYVTDPDGTVVCLAQPAGA